jgi:lysophospholipase L1-like esterase
MASSTITAPASPTPPVRRRPVRRTLHVLLTIGTLVLVAAASIAFALAVTPERTVTVLGQTISVGAAPPSWHLEGPGQAVLFGQTIPTQVRFIGPVRPRLTLTDISINEQVAGLFSPGPHAPIADTLGSALASGWRWYFVSEIGFVTIAAIVLLGAIAGWRRFHGRKTVMFIVAGLFFVEAINIGAIMVTAFTAPGILRDVHSLDSLIGRSQHVPVAVAPGHGLPAIEAVVLGDSTAAGLGGPAVEGGTDQDQLCQRSSFAFAGFLARVNDWDVDNLACSGATIEEGILGPQSIGGQTVPAQLAVAKRASNAKTVIVSVGANDLHWNTLVRVCAANESCDNKALTAYFQRSLATFTRDYLSLLSQLATLPNNPTIVVNQYYVPFDTSADCLDSTGLTPDKIDVLLQELQILNDVLANGAKTFGYLTVQPDFTGHELCTDQSYVQGLNDPAPVHPNARGQLWIALADESVLVDASKA